MYWIEIFLAFTAGVLVTKLLGAVLSVGFSALVLKQARDNFLRMIGHIAQSLHEVHQLRILEMHRMNKNEKEIEISSTLSEYNLNIMRQMVIRGFINTFPDKYSELIGFSDWDSAMVCLDELIKKEKANLYKKE
jgi:hypothetical protein